MAQNLLIVDDEPDMLNLLKRSLEPELGCRVDTASSGEAALSMIRTSDYDLVLADIKMPGISGLEVLEQVKADRRRDYSGDDDRLRSHRDGRGGHETRRL
jgi:CheY-like chemotaxis protein